MTLCYNILPDHNLLQLMVLNMLIVSSFGFRQRSSCSLKVLLRLKSPRSRSCDRLCAGVIRELLCDL